jgi:raffinose/stachyose/melibiose transport system substrate-binding protein
MKRATRVLMATALLGALVVPTAQAQDKTELRIWTLDAFGDTVQQAWDETIAAFEEANPTIDVVLEQRAVDAHKDALRVAAGTSEEPDIYFMWAGLGLAGEFIDLGVAAPLDDAYAAMGWNDRFTGPSLAKTQYGDHQYGVPYTNHAMAVYYRKDLFEKAGITEVPTTYDELIAVNDKLLAAGIQPIAFGGKDHWHIMRLTDSLMEATCGAEKHDALKFLQADWSTEPCATAAYTELDRWNKAGYLGDNFMGIGYQDAQGQWFTGDAAMMIEGDWMVNQLVDAGQDLANYAIFPFPTGTDRMYFFAEMNYPSASSDQMDAAVSFLDYFSSDEVQQKYLGQFGSIAVNKNVTYPEDTRPLDAWWVDLFNASTAVYEPADQAFPLDVNTEYWRIEDGVLTGDIAPADAAGQMQEFIANRP